MISKELMNALVNHMNEEFLSAHLYTDMAAYCANQGYDGMANFFIKQADEERGHAMKFFKFIGDVDGELTVSGIDIRPGHYGDVLEVFRAGLSHEQKITGLINSLMDMAGYERAYSVKSFLRWFVDEQVEEEQSFRKIISKMEKLGGSAIGLYQIDGQLAQR